MAFHIIIDGYNLIGAERGLIGNLEGKRNQLLKQLQEYQERKGFPITVVFDGWRSGWIREMEQRFGGIRVIFSQQGEKADNVIQRLAREMGSGCVVVTSDREVRSAAEASGAVAIYSGEFSAKLKNLDREPLFEEDEGFKGKRLNDSSEVERVLKRVQEKRGNPRRLSKTERKRRERLKKL